MPTTSGAHEPPMPRVLRCLLLIVATSCSQVPMHVSPIISCWELKHTVDSDGTLGAPRLNMVLMVRDARGDSLFGTFLAATEKDSSGNPLFHRAELSGARLKGVRFGFFAPTSDAPALDTFLEGTLAGDTLDVDVYRPRDQPSVLPPGSQLRFRRRPLSPTGCL